MMKRYGRYKDSGVEWIGEIPEGWKIKKLKYDSFLVMGQSPNSSECNQKREGLPFLQGNAEFGKIFPEEENWCCNPRKIAFKNDILISVRAPIGAVNIANKEYSIGRGLCSIRNDKFRFRYYLFLALHQELNSLGTGSTFKAVSTEQIENVLIPIPSLDEQTAISNYLDRKTAEIDALISQKEYLLELYEEEKNAIINQAVTKGIDPNVKLKDSSVDWLGKIPEHWKIKRLRYIGNCLNGVSQDSNYFGSGFPFVSYTDVYKNLMLPQHVEGLARSTIEDRINFSVVKGDVFFTRTSETIEEIGLTSTCLKTINDAVFAGFLIRFRPYADVLLEGFSKYYFRSQLHRIFFVKEMNLVTRASLSQELLKKLPVIIPPIKEQEQIGLYLDNKINIFGTKIAKTKKIIALYKEYRAALINEVVTGKIKITEEIES